MRIYKMTATFGKLEHQTLTLEPGLNIITAPNEWGKSTWCAFLIAMLYGIDTRSKSTKNTLAEKDRYEPWSGAPMEGRMELNWDGRDITIERRSKRRVPLGEFRAYETESGLPVAELTAENCGFMLLGVEQSVFRRTGFIRHGDLPVTQDEALRRRLNDLVTTGDENSGADRLAQALKELKNKCRYNRSGLLPQAETEKNLLEAKLAEQESLESQCRNLRIRIGELKDRIVLLSNHRQALEYTAYQETARRAAEARDAMETAEALLREQETVCSGLLAPEEARHLQMRLREFRQQWAALQTERENLPEQPVEPKVPEPFADMQLEEAKAMVREDMQSFGEAAGTVVPKILILMGFFGMAATALLVFLKAYAFAAVAGIAALAALVWGTSERRSVRKKAAALEAKYGSRDYRHWSDALAAYEEEYKVYQAAQDYYQQVTSLVQARHSDLLVQREELCSGKDPDTALEDCSRTVDAWLECDRLRREADRSKSHYEVLKALVKPTGKPGQPDDMTQSPEDTERLLSECAAEQQRLQNRLGQYQGRMEALGDPEELQKQLEKHTNRIIRLEQTYAALLLAQETLARAQAELQRRFAPRITRRAQLLLSQMTDGRYSVMTMGEDLSLRVRTTEEDTLYEAIWCSDGTMDQLYLALRLAVAEELTPNAPLVLDDALVRFDDNRMKAAVDVLEEIAKKKQVILFTCQGREKKA